nr:uncharacterized protein LOC128686717 [Cherax quadricarinatus]
MPTPPEVSPGGVGVGGGEDPTPVSRLISLFERASAFPDAFHSLNSVVSSYNPASSPDADHQGCVPSSGGSDGEEALEVSYQQAEPQPPAPHDGSRVSLHPLITPREQQQQQQQQQQQPPPAPRCAVSTYSRSESNGEAVGGYNTPPDQAVSGIHQHVIKAEASIPSAACGFPAASSPGVGHTMAITTYGYSPGPHQAYPAMATPALVAYPSPLGPHQGHYPPMGQMGHDVDIEVDRAEFDRYLSGPECGVRQQQLPGGTWGIIPHSVQCPQRHEYRQDQYREVSGQAYREDQYRMEYQSDPLVHYRGEGQLYQRDDYRPPDRPVYHPDDEYRVERGGYPRNQYRGDRVEYPGEQVYRGDAGHEYPGGEEYRGSVGGTLLSALADVRQMYLRNLFTCLSPGTSLESLDES